MIKINNILKYFLLTGSIFSEYVHVFIRFKFYEIEEIDYYRLILYKSSKDIFISEMMGELKKCLTNPVRLLHKILLYSQTNGLLIDEKIQFEILGNIAKLVYSKYCKKNSFSSLIYVDYNDLEHIISLVYPIVELIIQRNTEVKLVHGYFQRFKISDNSYMLCMYNQDRKPVVLNSKMKQILTTFFESPNQSEAGDICIIVKEVKRYGNNYLLDVRGPKNIQNSLQYFTYLILMSTLEKKYKVMTQDIKNALITLRHYLHLSLQFNLLYTFKLPETQEYKLEINIGSKRIKFNLDTFHRYLYLPKSLTKNVSNDTRNFLSMIEEIHLLSYFALEIKNKVCNLPPNYVCCLGELGIIEPENEQIYKLALPTYPLFFTSEFKWIKIAHIQIPFCNTKELAKIVIELPISEESIKYALQAYAEQKCLLNAMTTKMPPAIKERLFDAITKAIYLKYESMENKQFPIIEIDNLANIISPCHKIINVVIDTDEPREGIFYAQIFLKEKIFIFSAQGIQLYRIGSQKLATFLLDAARYLFDKPGEIEDIFFLVAAKTANILIRERLKGVEFMEPFIEQFINTAEPQINTNIATMLRKYCKIHTQSHKKNSK